MKEARSQKPEVSRVRCANHFFHGSHSVPCIVWIILLLLSGCVFRPAGTTEAQGRLEREGKPYQVAAEQRVLPEIPRPTGWREVLHRAFLANGELEAAYHEWAAAMARIDQAAAWPNSNVQVGFDYMFSRESMKAWDRTTLSAGFDPSMTLSLPVKARQAGKVAYDEAMAAGSRFEKAKFNLQKRVLKSYLGLALLDEKIRLQQTNLQLLKMLVESATIRVQAGAAQQDLLKAQGQFRLAENELGNMKSERRGMAAMLNGMMERDPEAELVLEHQLPAPRAVPTDDAHLVAIAADRTPDLLELAHQIQGKADALELARLRYLPDISPQASITGNVSKMVGAMVMLPSNLPAIRGAVKEAQGVLDASIATQRQMRNDHCAGFVAALYALRNAERQTKILQQTVAPAAEQALDSSRQAYAAGTIGFADLIDSQRMRLEVRQMIAEVKIFREQQVAELEALVGVDMEALSKQAGSGEATIKGEKP